MRRLQPNITGSKLGLSAIYEQTLNLMEEQKKISLPVIVNMSIETVEKKKSGQQGSVSLDSSPLVTNNKRSVMSKYDYPES